MLRLLIHLFSSSSVEPSRPEVRCEVYTIVCSYFLSHLKLLCNLALVVLALRMLYRLVNSTCLIHKGLTGPVFAENLIIYNLSLF